MSRYDPNARLPPPTSRAYDVKKMRDADVRQSLRRLLAAEHAGEASTLIVEELGLCQHDSRIDVAVVNGELNGFEIKSDSDTLLRLPHQADIYGRVFDRVTIVCGTAHLRDIRKLVPKWWGIVVAAEVGGIVELRPVRTAKLNRNIDMMAMIQLVWKNETAAILEQEGLASPSRWGAYQLWEAAVSNIERERLAFLIRETIKARGDWRSVPRQSSGGGSLRPAAKSLHSQAHTLLARIHQCSCPPN